MLPDDGPILLRRLLLKEGACLVGFARVSMLGLPITDTYPWGICFALQYDDNAVDALPKDIKWLEMNRTLEIQARHLYAIAEHILDSWGYQFGHITSKVPGDELPDLREELPQKTLATLAGLGWIGKSGLLITTIYGPRIRIGTILTNMPLPTAEATITGGCGQCEICVDRCPAAAIKGREWLQGVPRDHLLDVSKCQAHLWSTKRSLGRKQTCGLCVKVCPLGHTCG